MKKKKKKKFSFQKKKKVLKNETIYSYALACFTKYQFHGEKIIFHTKNV